jgi:hypothetical protein
MHPRRIVVMSKTECVTGIKPAVIGMAPGGGFVQGGVHILLIFILPANKYRYNCCIYNYLDEFVPNTPKKSS